MTPTRTAWLVVLLLCPVALLNYLDRQMLAAMKFSVMGDIPTIVTEANWGRMLGQFKWVYALVSPLGGYLADRYSRRWVICGSLFVWSAVTWATGHVDHLRRPARDPVADGRERGVLHPGRARARSRTTTSVPPARARSGSTRWRSTAASSSGGFSGYVADAPGLGWRWAFDACGLVGMAYALPLLLLLRDAAPRSSAPPAPTARRRVARASCSRTAPSSCWCSTSRCPRSPAGSCATGCPRS